VGDQGERGGREIERGGEKQTHTHMSRMITRRKCEARGAGDGEAAGRCEQG